MVKLTDDELWICAEQMIEDYGRYTPVCIATEIGRLALANDIEGVENWRGIAIRVSELMGFEIGQPVTKH